MPLAPPPHVERHFVEPLDLGERLAEPDDHARHAAVADDQVRAEAERHAPAWRDRAPPGTRARSSRSAGSNSHSAGPPVLNQTKRRQRRIGLELAAHLCPSPAEQASGAPECTALMRASRLASLRRCLSARPGRPFGDVAGAEADHHVARRGEVAQAGGRVGRPSTVLAADGRAASAPRPAPRGRRPRSAPRRPHRPARRARCRHR